MKLILLPWSSLQTHFGSHGAAVAEIHRRADQFQRPSARGGGDVEGDGVSRIPHGDSNGVYCNQRRNLMLRVFTVFILLHCAGYPSFSAAQSVGERLRVTTPDARYDGYLSAHDSTSFRLIQRDGNHLWIRHGEIVLLERHMGSRSYRKAGFLVGGGIGVAAGIALSQIADNSCERGTASDHSCDGKPWIDGRLAASIGGSTLAISGYMVGALIRSDIWQQTTFPTSGKLQFYPTLEVQFADQSACKVGIGLAVSFY